MLKWINILVITMLVVACGKNDNFRSTGAYQPNPYVQPPNPGVYPPQVQWQVPPQQPQQFQPFAPMYHYMQQNQQMAAYWQQMWYQWSVYSQQRQVPLYNFNYFWNDFCPEYWQSQPQYQQVYVWFDYNVYNSCGNCF